MIPRSRNNLVLPSKASVWDKAKLRIVEKGSDFKFSQNAALKQLILGTDDRLLVEASPEDCIWGIGLSAAKVKETPREKWKGENLLGKALTVARGRIRDEDLND